MRWSFSHPNTDTLGGFASHTLPARVERRVAQHLESCVECRDTVIVFRAVDDEAHDAQPRDELLERILASRAAGRRTILPVDDATVTARRWPVARLAGLATAAVLLAVVLGRGSREVSAGERTGYLRLDPARPLPRCGRSSHIHPERVPPGIRFAGVAGPFPPAAGRLV